MIYRLNLNIKDENECICLEKLKMKMYTDVRESSLDFIYINVEHDRDVGGARLDEMRSGNGK